MFLTRAGFPELTQDDQLILIKIGFFEVWLGHVSRLINAQEGSLTMADGSTFSRQQLELIFDVKAIAYLIQLFNTTAYTHVTTVTLRQINNYEYVNWAVKLLISWLYFHIVNIIKYIVCEIVIDRHTDKRTA